MSKKRIRISQKEADLINGYRKSYKREKFLTAKFLYRYENVEGSTTAYSFRLKARARWIPYLVILPFVLVAKFLYCLWDGGLKSYTWEGPTIVDRRINMYNYPADYQACMNVWDERTQ